MTVKELIDNLTKLPQDLLVVFPVLGEWRYSEVKDAKEVLAFRVLTGSRCIPAGALLDYPPDGLNCVQIKCISVETTK